MFPIPIKILIGSPAAGTSFPDRMAGFHTDLFFRQGETVFAGGEHRHRPIRPIRRICPAELHLRSGVNEPVADLPPSYGAPFEFFSRLDKRQPHKGNPLRRVAVNGVLRRFSRKASCVHGFHPAGSALREADPAHSFFPLAIAVDLILYMFRSPVRMSGSDMILPGWAVPVHPITRTSPQIDSERGFSHETVYGSGFPAV